MGTVTDCYNPYEVKYGITRSILEQLVGVDCYLQIATKNKLILRDLDLLKKMKHRIRAAVDAHVHVRRCVLERGADGDEPRAVGLPQKAVHRLAVVAAREQRRAALRQNTLIHIINRENVQWLVEQSKQPFDYDMIVIDELSSFKSYQAKRFRSLMKVRPKVKRIVGLTGTPSSNGLMDLWAEFRLLDMGKRLGRFITKYREVFFLPDRRNAQQVFSWKPRPSAEDEIYGLIGDITISMKSVDFLKMPECISNRVPVRLSRSERDTYDELKRELVTLPASM